jgi:hypothetical protein
VCFSLDFPMLSWGESPHTWIEWFISHASLGVDLRPYFPSKWDCLSWSYGLVW